MSSHTPFDHRVMQCAVPGGSHLVHADSLRQGDMERTKERTTTACVGTRCKALGDDTPEHKFESAQSQACHNIEKAVSFISHHLEFISA